MQPNREATARTVAVKKPCGTSLPHGLTARERIALTALPLRGWRTTRQVVHDASMPSVLSARLSLLMLASRGFVAHRQAPDGAVWRLTGPGRLAASVPTYGHGGARQAGAGVAE